MGQTFTQMKSSASEGCFLCYMRHSQLSAEDIDQISQKAEIKYGYWESRVGNGIAFVYAPKLGGSELITKSIAFISDEEYPSSLIYSHLRSKATIEAGSSMVSEFLPRTSINAPSTFEIIRHWIKNCMNNHESCRELVQIQRRLLTRLIDVGTGNLIRPVLCSSRHLPLSTLYTTLSHCWGGKGGLHLHLRQSNLRSLEQAMPIGELSETFRNAMEVTYRLGIRYIWIDSLCIIQDSQQDWQEQAILMGENYRHSYCNIAATAANDGTFGLFQERNLFEVQPCHIMPQWRGHQSRGYYCHAIGIWDRDVEEQPLLSRAWAVQELVLAPRIIHFGQTQVFWECSQNRACETFPDKIPNFSAQKLGLRRLPFPDSMSWLGLLDINDGNYPHHETWTKVVSLFSRGDMTYKAKLMAISGVARNLPMPAEDYLAGLWRDGLPCQLLWTTTRIGTNHHTTWAADYSGPSWSWASVDEPVILRTPTLEDMKHSAIKILAVSTTQNNPSDPYGQVSHGEIRLQGPMAYDQLSQQVTTTTTRYVWRNQKFSEEPLEPGTLGRTITHRYLGQTHINIFMDSGDPEIGKDYICLLVNDRFGGCGLVLRPTRANRGEYTRAGYFAVLTGKDTNSPAKFRDCCKKFDGAAAEDEMLYESKADIDDEGRQRYAISII